MILQAPDELVHGETFNIASGQHRSIGDIARDVVSLMNYRPDRIRFIDDRPGQVVRHTGDWSKINRVLGWKPLFAWRQGLQRTIAWYEANRDAWSRQLFMRQIPIITASGKVGYH
jgi:dTDP-glucose 4,6-dehydratase